MVGTASRVGFSNNNGVGASGEIIEDIATLPAYSPINGVFQVVAGGIDGDGPIVATAVVGVNCVHGIDLGGSGC